ncbi:MAG: hypothetical protein ABIF01_00640 [Candidatus Micrarchaeota archaeon]
MDRNLFIFFAVWFVAVTLLCTLMISDIRTIEIAETAKPVFSFLVKGCAESEKGMATRAFQNDERGPGLVISGGELLYYRAINHLCCRHAEVRGELAGSDLDIYETWSGEGCRCMCFSEISAKFGGLAPGRYSLNVYETGTKPGSGEPMEMTVILRKEFFIIPQ